MYGAQSNSTISWNTSLNSVNIITARQYAGSNRRSVWPPYEWESESDMGDDEDSEEGDA